MKSDDKMISVNLILFIAICTVVPILLYISCIQYKRAEKALETANILAFNMEQIKEYIREASETLANPQLRAAFEADDEVGTFFKQISSIQEVLDQFLPENEEASSNIE